MIGTWLDAAVVGIVALSGILAFARGFVREMLSVAGWVIAGIATYYALPHIKPIAESVLGPSTIAHIVGGVVVFVAVLLVCGFLNGIIGRLIKESPLGFLDRILGLAFGVARGGLLVCLAWLLLEQAFSDKNMPDWMKNASLKNSLERGANLIRQATPEQWFEKGSRFIRDATGQKNDPPPPAKGDEPVRPDPRPR